MIKPANGRTGKLKALLESKIDTPAKVMNTLCKGGYYGWYCPETLRVEIEAFVPRKLCRAPGPSTKQSCSSRRGRIDDPGTHQ